MGFFISANFFIFLKMSTYARYAYLLIYSNSECRKTFKQGYGNKKE